MIRGKSVRTRRGAISALVLFAIPALLLLVGLVVYTCLVRDARIESQAGADAAALAAARPLVTDDRLVRNASLATAAMKLRAAEARDAAGKLARANYAAGEQVQIDTEADKDDVVFGRLRTPLSTQFTLLTDDLKDCDGSWLNAVRVTVRRKPVAAPLGGPTPDRQVVAKATAMLDWSVVGFHPGDDRPAPLMPVGLYTVYGGTTPNTWDEAANTAHTGDDAWGFNPKLIGSQYGPFVAGPDGIPEIRVVVGRQPTGTGGSDSAVSGCFLQLDLAAFDQSVFAARMIAQIEGGLRKSQDNAETARTHVLNRDNVLNIPGCHDCPVGGSDAQAALLAAFIKVRDKGEPRAWPLYTTFTETVGGSPTIVVSGWAAARVVAVQPLDNGAVELLLQPTVLNHPTVVTESRENAPAPAFWASNKTVCKVRLAD